jgi:hypothetical protein
MILIQVLNEYQHLANLGNFNAVKCAMDNDHPILSCSLSENDEPYMYCLACSYKLKPGSALYFSMKDRIEEYYRARKSS